MTEQIDWQKVFAEQGRQMRQVAEDLGQNLAALLDKVPRPTVEYGQLMCGGGYHLRNPHPEIERVYPLDEWIAAETRNGGRVFRRRVWVVEDWTEVTEP